VKTIQFDQICIIGQKMNPNSTSRKRSERPIRILNAAGRLVTRYGYDKTTMDEIAREAGVSKGACTLCGQAKKNCLMLCWSMR